MMLLEDGNLQREERLLSLQVNQHKHGSTYSFIPIVRKSVMMDFKEPLYLLRRNIGNMMPQ